MVIIGKLDNEESPVDADAVKQKRIGVKVEGKVRALLVTVLLEEKRNDFVQKARNNNDLGTGIRVKKDSHPAVRAEWTRLFNLKATEEAKAENAGKVVAIDMKKRHVTIDGQIIDSWKPLFLDRWNSTPSTCTIVSLNIQGAKTKLQAPHFSHFLSTFDIVCLHELKTPLEIHLPGYVCYRKKSDNPHRGGSALLIKDALTKQVAQVRTPSAECVLISLKSLPSTTIATCYIPPEDSAYHSFGPIAEIQAEMTRNPERNMIVIGDLI